MVTRRIMTANGEQWAFYPDIATAKKYDGVDNEIVPCTVEQMLLLSGNPSYRYDGKGFSSPTLTTLVAEGTEQ